MTSNTSESASFHQSFQKQKTRIVDALDQSQPSVSEITSRLTALRNDLAKTRGGLPSYDQRSYDIQVKDLETRLSTLRAKEKPKSKFTFTKSGTSKATALLDIVQPTISQGEAIPPVSGQGVTTPTPGSTSSTSHILSNYTQTILRPASHLNLEGVSTYTLTLSDLSSCLIDLRHPSTPTSTARLTALHAKNLKGCVLVGPIIQGSVMLSDLEGCLVIIGAHQFRMHSSLDNTILIHVDSIPIIEGCKSLRIGGYPPGLRSEVATLSRHEEMQDFDWVRVGPSPHWRSIEPGEELPQERLDLLDGSQTTDVADLLGRLLPSKNEEKIQYA